MIKIFAYSLFLLTIFKVNSCNAQDTSSWNLGFEEWVDSTLWPINLMEPNGFEIENPNGGRLRNWDAFGRSVRTTDATQGKYAIVLSNWYYGIYRDFLVLGENGKPSHTGCKDCGYPIDYRPNTLTGDYKLFLLNGDSLRGEIMIYITKYNLSTNKRDTVGTGLKFLRPVNEYTSSFASIPNARPSVDVDPVSSL